MYRSIYICHPYIYIYIYIYTLVRLFWWHVWGRFQLNAMFGLLGREGSKKQDLARLVNRLRRVIGKPILNLEPQQKL